MLVSVIHSLTSLRYIPHANRALRSLNMYLNVRQPPLRTKIPFSPFSFLFPRTVPATSTPSTPTATSPLATPLGQRRSPSPSRVSKRSSSVPIAPIPPSSNPRGELIFSSRVDRSFRESYERYRNAFDRRREERERAAYEVTWTGWICVKILRLRRPLIFGNMPTGLAGGGGSGTATPLGRAGSATGSMRGTPSSSRRSSPVPSRVARSRSALNNGGSERNATPPIGTGGVATITEDGSTSRAATSQ